MIRSLMVAWILGVAGAAAQVPQAGTAAPQSAVQSAQADALFPGKTELLRRIALYETAERKVEASPLDLESTAKVYANLASLYEYAGMDANSEVVMRKWISLLRSGPQNELAEAISQLAVLHVAMGELSQAEKDQLEALRVRQGVGDPVGIALSLSDLADIDIKQKRFKQAVDYAQQAMPVLADNPAVDVANRIAIRQTLAFAMCGDKECAQAIPIMKDAIELSRTSYGTDSLPVGIGYYLLGYLAWHSGDMVDAAEWMQRGTARMKIDLGWGHAVYVNAMDQYSRFLRQDGQTEAAASAQREVRQAQTIVDARALAPNPNAFLPGPQ